MEVRLQMREDISLDFWELTGGKQAVGQPVVRERSRQQDRVHQNERLRYGNQQRSRQRDRVHRNERLRYGSQQRSRQQDRVHRNERLRYGNQQHSRLQYSRQRRKRQIRRKMTVLGLSGLIVVLLICLLRMLTRSGIGEGIRDVVLQEGGILRGIENTVPHPDWTEDFLTVNEYSRPGTRLHAVKDIFVHYTANPGTNAVQNRSYFEQLKDTHERSASAHFIIGYEGDILQCVPLNEVAYAVKTRNEDSMSIECCYLDEDGSFTQETYDSLIELLAWLLREYDLTTENILRHYDCGGKKCPLYYTEHEDAWAQLKADVQAKLDAS